MLEKKEKVLMKKAAAEVEKAKEFTRAKNKRGMEQQTVFLAVDFMAYVYVYDSFFNDTFHVSDTEVHYEVQVISWQINQASSPAIFI